MKSGKRNIDKRLFLVLNSYVINLVSRRVNNFHLHCGDIGNKIKDQGWYINTVTYTYCIKPKKDF